MSSLSSVGSASPSISGLAATTAGTTAAGNTTASNQGTLAVNGLISGLNTSAIITGLLAVQQAQITNLQTQQQTLTSQDTAFKGIEAKLLALQSDAAQLARPQSGPFDAKQAVSSDTTQINAAASSDASAGVYTLQVNHLATAEQIASQGFASLTSSITQGTFQLQVGNGATTSITVDGTNDTLQGLATAINNSGAPVTATIVNDGSSAQPFRLLLTANQSGADNKITISNSLAADAGGASKPVFDATYIGQAATGSGYSGTSTPTANVGAGTYTGTTNNTYTFTVVNGGTVGTDNGIQLSYTDTSGQHTGTINLSSSDAGVLQNVDQGIQVQFSAGTLVQGQTFTVNAYTPVIQPGASASVTLGSGAGALTVQSDSNTVDGLINGVTLSLVGADANNPVTVTVGSNTTSASQSIQNFVQDYNNFITSVNSQVSYDAQTQTAGVLLGQSAATGIETQIQGLVLNTVQGLNPLLNQLGALGITPNTDGTLTVNTTQLNATLSGQTPGVTLNDVRQLFALAGQSTNSGVQFVTGTDQTKAGTYQVNITQAATQGSLTATNGLAASTSINNTNNTLNFTVDGQTSQTLTLAAGTYTPAALANELQAEINGDSSLAGRNVTVTVNNNNQLVVTSASFGSSSNVAVGTGSALSALGFAGTESGAGQDVAGSFTVNGVTEAATGSGQLLIGDPTNANTAGLEVRVPLAASQVQGGLSANLTVTRGIASTLDTTLNSLLDPVTGRFQAIDQGYQDQTTALQNEINQQQQAINDKQAQLVTEFTNMESTLAQLQQAGNILSTQFQTQLAATSTTSKSTGQSAL